MLHPGSCDHIEDARVRGVELRGRYRGNSFSIVTDYDAISGRWPVQIYINGVKCRSLVEGQGFTLIEAERWGLSAVEHELDARLRIAAARFITFG